MSRDYYLADRTKYVPPGADYCLAVTDDCMSPAIRRGDVIYVSCTLPVEPMDAALFYHKGQVICRQWCEDSTGAIHLLCANPARESCNIRFGPGERERCICLGKVLLKKKLPAPIYD